MSCITTACALDCYDACKIIVDKDSGAIKGDSVHPAGNGALCTLINKSIHKEQRITLPRVKGKEVSMEEAMREVSTAFKVQNALLWRGSGNMGVMQEVTNLFMEKISGTLTHGSLCDGAGDAGILSGRGVNKTLPLEQIKHSDTVVVWGRNITVTNAHMMPFIEGKKTIVIDPVRTAIAKKADVHIPLNPGTDFFVALMLARMICQKGAQDSAWIELFTQGYDSYKALMQNYTMHEMVEHTGVGLEVLEQAVELLCQKKVVFLVGIGVQKYVHGATVLRAIDSLAALLGMFGKEGSGVHYLGDSKLGFDNPFSVSCKTVSKVVTPFSQFQTVLVQGGNPAESMPNSSSVCEALDTVENLIYFGLYENETSKRAKIVIPAKNFFEKEDIRLSYGHPYIEKMHTAVVSNTGISEYDFTKRLFDAFGFEGLKSESAYIDRWLSQCKEAKANLVSPAYETVPYAEGFGKAGEKRFVFLQEGEALLTENERLYLLTPKSNKALNTQFKRDAKVQVHPLLGHTNGEKVTVRSAYGSVELTVVCNEDIPVNSIVISSNTKGVNLLTPPKVSYAGHNACYQDVEVSIEKTACQTV